MGHQKHFKFLLICFPCIRHNSQAVCLSLIAQKIGARQSNTYSELWIMRAMQSCTELCLLNHFFSSEKKKYQADNLLL